MIAIYLQTIFEENIQIRLLFYIGNTLVYLVYLFYNLFIEIKHYIQALASISASWWLIKIYLKK